MPLVRRPAHRRRDGGGASATPCGRDSRAADHRRADVGELSTSSALAGRLHALVSFRDASSPTSEHPRDGSSAFLRRPRFGSIWSTPRRSSFGARRVGRPLRPNRPNVAASPSTLPATRQGLSTRTGRGVDGITRGAADLFTQAGWGAWWLPPTPTRSSMEIGVARSARPRSGPDLVFEQVRRPPAWVAVLVGTTGLPNAIVHGHGVSLVDQLRSAYNLDLRAGYRMVWFNTTFVDDVELPRRCCCRTPRSCSTTAVPRTPTSARLWHLADSARSRAWGCRPG